VNVYLETSALLAWLLGQKSAAEVRSSVDAAGSVWTSALTFAEAGRNLAREESSKRLRASEYQKLRGVLAKARRGWMTFQMSEDILRRASEPFPVEPIRTLDAIHLATALELARALPDISVLSLDRRILENAEALGLR